MFFDMKVNFGHHCLSFSRMSTLYSIFSKIVKVLYHFNNFYSVEMVPNTTSSQCPQYKPIVKLNTGLDTNQGGDLVDMHQFDTGDTSLFNIQYKY